MRLIDPPGDNLKSVAAAIALNNRQLRDFFSILVLGQSGEVFRLEYVSATVNLVSTNAQSNSSNTIDIPGLAVGDLCFYIGVDSLTATTFIHQTIPVCTVAGQITMRSFNADNVAVDADETTFHFLVIHRS